MNNKKIRAFHSDAEKDAVATRYALRVAARLSEADVPHDIAERLRISREHAARRAAAAAQRRPTAVSAVASNRNLRLGQGEASLGLGSGDGRGMQGWTMLLPALALLAGLWLIDKHWTRSQVEAAAEVDSALLTDELPPVAYSDAGFVEFLKTPLP
jgi:hypothetical protein